MPKVYKLVSSNSYKTVSSIDTLTIRSESIANTDETSKTVFRLGNCLSNRPTPGSCVKAIELLYCDDKNVVVDFSVSALQEILDQADEDYIMQYSTYAQVPDPVDEDVYDGIQARVEQRRTQEADQKKTKSAATKTAKAKSVAEQMKEVSTESSTETSNPKAKPQKPVDNDKQESN